jgi:hypothetical protein
VSEALVKVEQETALDRPHPRAVIKAATEEANVLAEVIESRKLFSMIQGRKYVKVEGWTTLATLRGCLPREIAVHEMPEGRYVAEVELVRMSDGAVLTRASAECGGDGDNIWRGRPANARRSMAITRATGKAARVAFSWVMALAGYEPTPLEEMDHVGGQPPEDNAGPAPRATEATSRQWPARGVPPPDKTVDAAPVWTGRLVDMTAKPGKTNGKPWTLFTFKGEDGETFGTFSETIASSLTSLEKGSFVEIVYSTTAKGNKTIEEWRNVTAEQVPL